MNNALEALLPLELKINIENLEKIFTPEKILENIFNPQDLHFLCVFKECESRCCKNAGRRFVLISDLLLLKKAGLEKHVLGKYPAVDIAKKLLERSNDIDYYREHYVIPSLENKIIFGQSQCFFLNTNYNCSIYEQRPSICRVYPFSFQTKLSKPQISTHQNKLCPPSAHGEIDWQQLKQIAIDITQDALLIKQTLYLLAYKREELKMLGLKEWL
jgi:Fe-S-cluster containining protein